MTSADAQQRLYERTLTQVYKAKCYHTNSITVLLSGSSGRKNILQKWAGQVAAYTEWAIFV